MKKIKVQVTPTLSPTDRKSLSTHIQMLKNQRSGYFTPGSTIKFDYRGSLVIITCTDP